MEVWDMLVLLPFDAIVTIADSDENVLFSGHKHNVPMDMRNRTVERIAPCHDYMQDSDYLWIEVI